jgi:acyl carrier protein
MLRPKLAGGWLLHELSQAHPVDHFVLFSSTTALWGSRSLAHYAAANQALDALAHYRHHLGMPALSINWGTWDEMRVASEAEKRSVAEYGLQRMPSDQALATLGALLGTAVAQIAVAAVQWEQLKPVYEARRVRPLLAHMAVPAPLLEKLDTPTTVEEPELLRRVRGLTGDERRTVITDFVRTIVARSLGIGQAHQIDDRQGLFEMGLDSLMSVELKNRLERSVGQSLPATLTFNYPSVADLSSFFADELLSEQAAQQAEEMPDAGSHQSPADAPDSSDMTDMDDLTEDDLAELLAAKLARLS